MYRFDCIQHVCDPVIGMHPDVARERVIWSLTYYLIIFNVGAGMNVQKRIASLAKVAVYGFRFVYF